MKSDEQKEKKKKVWNTFVYDTELFHKVSVKHGGGKTSARLFEPML